MKRAPTNGVEHLYLWRIGPRSRNGIVLRQLSDVGIEAVPSAPQLSLLVRTAGEVAAPHPIALLEAVYLGAEVGQALRERRAGGTGTDHQNIGAIHHHQSTGR